MKTSTEKNGIHLSWCQFIVLLCIFIGVTVAVGLIIGLTESGCKCKEDITVTPEFKPYDYPILPQTMLPVHYDVSIQPYLDTGSPSTEFTFTGEVDVIVQCQAETYRIFLNLRNLTVYETSVSVRELGNYTSARRRGYSTRNHVDVHSTEYDLINEFYIINLWKKLKVGKKYGIYMQFIGWLKDDLRGFYRSKYTTKGGDVRDLIAELGQPVLPKPPVFSKPTTAYVRQGENILIPYGCKYLYYEVELGVVIGQRGKNIQQMKAMEYVGGYALALDMIAHELQSYAKKNGYPWLIAKGFDTSCPVSELISTAQVPNPQDVELWLKVNGAIRQKGNTSNMVMTIPELLSYVSRYITLEESDLILTGTPAGVGPVYDGDVIECGLGQLLQMQFTVKNA